jgi:hypothetical protein
MVAGYNGTTQKKEEIVIPRRESLDPEELLLFIRGEDSVGLKDFLSSLCVEDQKDILSFQVVIDGKTRKILNYAVEVSSINVIQNLMEFYKKDKDGLGELKSQFLNDGSGHNPLTIALKSNKIPILSLLLDDKDLNQDDFIANVIRRERLLTPYFKGLSIEGYSLMESKVAVSLPDMPVSGSSLPTVAVEFTSESSLVKRAGEGGYRL